MVSGSDFYTNPLTDNYGVEFVLKLAWYLMEKTKAMWEIICKIGRMASFFTRRGSILNFPKLMGFVVDF